jgi:hypothetical protein
MQPGAAAHHGGVPRVDGARGGHPGGAEPGGHPDYRADVAQVPWLVQHHQRRGPRQARGRRVRAPGEPGHPRGMGAAGQRGQHAGGHLDQQVGQLGGHVGGQRGGQRERPTTVRGQHRVHLGAEPQRVLDGVEPVQQHHAGGRRSGPPARRDVAVRHDALHRASRGRLATARAI